MSSCGLKVKKLPNYVAGPTRERGNVGWDLHSAEDFRLGPGERGLVKTGLAVDFYPSYYLRIAPRSGLALKHGLDVLAGVIDPSYRGEICVLLLNTGKEPLSFVKGERIAQMIAEQIATEREFDFVDELPESTRGEGGFGSTGR